MVIGGLVAVIFVTTLRGQQKGIVINNFRAPEYYEAPYQNQIKFLLTGSEGRPLEGGKVLLKQVKMETFAKTGERETIASAPECVYDTVNQALSSAGPMQMQTADGKFLIQGEGFLVRQTKTNFSVIISNKVETTIHKELLAAQTSQTKTVGLSATNSAALSVPPAVNTNVAIDTNQFIKIFSHQANLNTVSNLAIYSDNVRVVDPQMDLTCEVMTLRRSTNGSLESVVAETNVVIVGKQDNSRATGEKAVYIVNPDTETMKLLGNAHWQDDQREAKADSFIFDRKDNTIRAEPNAWLKLPRAAINQTGPLATKSIAPTNAPAGTNEFIEITSQVLTMQLPTTNRPARVIIAQTNVVILSPSDKSRATGDEAVYTEANGTLMLSGKAMWISDQRLVKGGTLTFDRTNEIFTARSNAYLKLPMAAFGKTSLLASGSAQTTNNAALTNQFIEVFSDDYDYRDNLLSFRENVRANFLEGEEMKGWLTCGLLTVQVTNNQVRSIVARHHVAGGQVPSPADTARKVYKKLNSETLTVNVSTNGQAESFVAEEKVVAKQDEVRPGTNDIHTTLTADVVTGYFFAQTNQVEKMIAERNVFVEQGERSAKGAKAVYTATNNLVELTGQPTANLPEGQITEVEALIWDRANEKLSARGLSGRGRFISKWKRPPGGTNQTNLLFPK